MESVYDYSHPHLGNFRGLTSESTQRFLGVRYANLSDKFSPAKVNEEAGHLTDATAFGPAAPSPPNGVEHEFQLIQKALPYSPVTQSDTECLNLNITAPKGTSPTSNLPVIAYLHGGGFVIGANFWPHYRLGAPGFLTSCELVSHGYKPNNGLHDQRVALLWIQKFISGFGGDPSNITLAGESAGGVSATTQLQSEIPLFRRMVCLGGTNLLMQPLPDVVSEKTYQEVIGRLGLTQLEPSARVKALVQTPTKDLLSEISPKDPLQPTLGGDLGIKSRTYAEIYEGSSELDLPGREWCEEIMVGDSQMDASIFASMFDRNLAGVAEAFYDSFTRSLGSEDRAIQVSKAYNISEALSDEKALENILNFAQDLKFFFPVLCYAHCWSGRAYVFHFNEPNTWDGPLKGHANHILDVAYLFQNYNEHVTDRQRAVATQFAEDLILFANSKSPWRPFKYENMDLYSRIYGVDLPVNPNRVATVKGPVELSKRRDVIFEIMKTIPADELSKAWGMFMTGM
ncbi:uncharacterized protein N7446_003830 [Penicillium canescens]|uniref:uncharacterized protein n=1 Tax=Penicillium canescens TaxID=5083 RepID=UPI0026E043BB|nr:uncharacterized protein N7446_003830 [Penicillium canescens]KAJ6040854.1 hypothetical protein N7444_009759 [Penicillium canescens]KAJ6066793.1 hypothetical protein N7446_003830 [Penicillium canescens]